MRLILCAIVIVSFAAMTSAPASPRDEPPPPPRAGSLLIVFGEKLEAAAGAWADYRRAGGFAVTLFQAPATSDSIADEKTIQARIRESFQAFQVQSAEAHGEQAEFYVLLLGDVDSIPARHFAQVEEALREGGTIDYITDGSYQLADDTDQRPDFALGRIPAASSEDALTVLEKIRRYEGPGPRGLSSRRIDYVASEGHFGMLDLLLETLFGQMIDRFVPDVFDVSMTYASCTSMYCPPPEKVTDAVLDRLREGGLLFNYIGHGSAGGLDHLYVGARRTPILRAEDLARLEESRGQLPIALLTCCSTGWFDLPRGRRCLAEAMLLHPSGPIAVIAASRPSHPYANAVLQKDITRALLVDRVATIGELDLQATRSMLHIDATDRELDAVARPLAKVMKVQTSLAGLREMHTRMYNLLGDPCTRIASSRQLAAKIVVDGDAVRGSVDGMVRGVAIVTFETDRTTPADSESLQTVRGADDPELSAKMAANYPRANERVLSRHEAEVVEGNFSIALPESLPARAAVVKVYAAGTDAKGAAVEAIGAVRLRASSGKASSSP
jgi:hypothetical protein